MKTGITDILKIRQNDFEKHLLPHEQYVIDSVFNKENPKLPDNTSNVAEYAIRNGVGPLLSNLPSSKLLDKNNRNLLKKSHFSTLVENTHRWQALETIHQVLTESKIPHLFLKGSLLAYTTYRDSSLRPMSDIDVLVNEEDAQSAYLQLKKSGATGPEFPSYLSDADHHLPALMLNGTMIEIHRMLFPVNARYNIPNKELFESTQQWRAGNTVIPGPTTHLSAFYIATHLYYTYLRGGLRIGWFYDIYTLRTLLQEPNAEQLLKDARRLKLMKPLSFVNSAFYFMTQQNIPNWPTDEKLIPDTREIKQIVKCLRGEYQEQSSSGYALVWEQIQEANDWHSKWTILKDKITANNSLKGKALIKHLLTISWRNLEYLFNLVRKKIN